MPSASHSTVVPAPPEAVFAFIADGENARSWRPGVLDIKLVSGSGVGAAYAQGVRGPGGRRIAADYEITTFEPGRRLAFRATAGPVRPEGTYTLEAVPGGTRIDFALSAELGGLKGLLMGRSVQSTMNSEVASIDRIADAMGLDGAGGAPASTA
ncbi:MAG TPA: SRPBCC family protein [Candidatus Limnocylindrales bacterium]